MRGELISLPVTAEAHRVADRISERLETKVRAWLVLDDRLCAKSLVSPKTRRGTGCIRRAKMLRAADAKRCSTRVEFESADDATAMSIPVELGWIPFTLFKEDFHSSDRKGRTP